MLDLFRPIFSCFLISFFLFANVISVASAMDEHKTHSVPTPTKSHVPYGGLEHKDEIKKVQVSSCVSLGGSCIDKINNIVQGADQFVVAFMYRFNSPSLIKTLGEKHLSNIPVIVFLDYVQTYESSMEGSHYPMYVQRLIESVPTSLVKLGGRAFHQKVIISKRAGEEAVVVLGSANATFEADNEHSEDLVFIQSNELAKIYLTEFKALMRMEPIKKSEKVPFTEPQVKVFHEHRVKPKESNVEYLESLLKILDTKKDKSTLVGGHVGKDKSTLVGGHVGDVVAVAISTGFPNEEGTRKCLDVVHGVLGNPKNDFLILFENFISLHEPSLAKPVFEKLKDKTPKLIVLDNNKHNIAALDGEYELLPMSELPKGTEIPSGKVYLEKDHDKLHYAMMMDEPVKGTVEIKIKNKKLTPRVLNMHKAEILKKLPTTKLEGIKTKENVAFLFKPFSGGKFHHKLIIQYPQDAPAVVYTGSFHISTNTILRNSENIIGIRSDALADEHLASILLYSGLGEDLNVWKFIIKQKRLRKVEIQLEYHESRVLQAARMLLKKCHDNMGRYLDRLERIRSDIHLAATYADHQIEIDKYFDKYMEDFEKGDAEEKLEAIEELKKAVFGDSIPKIYQPYMQKQWKVLAKKLEDLDELPDYEALDKHVWLKEIGEWITYAKEEAKFEDVNIKEEIESIETVYVALNDLEEYETTFNKIKDLGAILKAYIGK